MTKVRAIKKEIFKTKKKSLNLTDKAIAWPICFTSFGVLNRVPCVT